MSSRRIAYIINKKLKDDGKKITIHKATICRILNKELGKPRKIKRTFFLSKENKKRRVEFCQKMLSRKIKGNQILFTDETAIDMGSYTNDSIRLSKENREKLRKGEKEAFDLINREEKKFEPKIMVAGGISSVGITDLIISEGTLNEFAYAQALLFYKDSYEKIKNQGKIDLYFEQDGASAHTSSSNKKLIDDLFGKIKLIQNPPNSPDLAYPIENIWGFIKPRIKRRNPKTYDELKKFTLEEWNLIPTSMIKNCGLSYQKRLEKVIELKGERLEPYHLEEIKKEMKEEKQKMEEEDDDDEEEEKKDLKMKVVFNDKRLSELREKEIRRLKRLKKDLKKDTRKKIKKNNEKTVRIPGIAQLRKKRKEQLKEKLEKDLNKIDETIKNIGKMTIVEYLRYTKEAFMKKKKANEDDESTIEESINKILKIEELAKKLESNIKYEIEF